VEAAGFELQAESNINAINAILFADMIRLSYRETKVMQQDRSLSLRERVARRAG